MRSRSFGRNGSKFIDPLGLGTLFYTFRLDGRDRDHGKNPLCSSRSSKSHEFNHHIGPIKETFHGCAHGSKNLFSHGVIDGDGLELSLKNLKQKNKGERNM